MPRTTLGQLPSKLDATQRDLRRFRGQIRPCPTPLRDTRRASGNDDSRPRSAPACTRPYFPPRPHPRQLMSDLSRRDLLKAAALATAGIATAGPFSNAIAEHITAGSHPDLAPPAPPNRKSMRAVPFARHDVVRVGMVGTGLRGRSVLTELLGVDGVKIVALCDVVPEKAQMAAKMVTDKGQPAPALYTQRRSRLRAARRARRPRPRLHGDAVGMAHAGDARRARARQARGERVPDRHDAQGSLGARRRERARAEALHAARELQLRLQRDDGEPDGPRRLFGEVLHAEAAYLHDLRKILFENEGRRTLAPRLAHALQLQSLSDARTRPRELVSRRPRRRSLRLHRHRRARRSAGCRSTARRRSTSRIRAGASGTSPATSTRRSSRR